MGTVKTGKIKSVLKSQKKAVSASPTITQSRKHRLTANAREFVIWGAGVKDTSGRISRRKFVLRKKKKKAESWHLSHVKKYYYTQNSHSLVGYFG